MSSSSASGNNSGGGTNGRDPSGFISSPPSVAVKVVGTARDDINGLFGIVISYNIDRERYLVHMTKSQSTMALKKENLVRASMMETYQAQFEQLRNDPRVREKMTQYWTLCQQHVAPLNLTHVLAGVATMWLLLFYFIGFTKTTMVTSLIILLLVIAGPDLLARSSPQVLIQNFPDRARVIIEQQLPILRGKISNQIAVGVVVLLVFICIQSLFFTGGSSKPRMPPAPEIPVMDRPLIERYYEMGFHDATKGHERGFSLVRELESLNLLDVDQPLELDEYGNPKLPPPPAEKPKSFISKFSSLSNIASMFFLYRSVVDLGTDQSTNLFSVGQLAANLQHNTEWWRKALLALSLYNVLRIFL